MTQKIEVSNLVKIFGKNPSRGVKMLQSGVSKEDILRKAGLTVGVADASFSVKQGQIFVVMGLSGSGKSTLIRCLNRLHDPTAGSIKIDGVEITSLEAKEMRAVRREKMGMVFQSFALLPHRSIVDNVSFGLEIKGVSRTERREKAIEAIELVGLSGYEEQLPAQLSGGMQQRVGLARALASDPDVLLMDEPFSALDPLIRKDMQEELLRLQGKMNKTIVFITHDLDEALSLGDNIAIMKDGVIVQQGTAEEILMNPADEYVIRFTESVDRTSILTAENIMQKPLTVASFEKDGANSSLRKMETHGLTTLLVVDHDRKLLGGLVPDDLVKAKGKNDLKPFMSEDVPRVSLDTPVHDMLATASDTPFPIAVLDKDDRLLGVIVRSMILAALSRRGEV